MVVPETGLGMARRLLVVTVGHERVHVKLGVDMSDAVRSDALMKRWRWMRLERLVESFRYSAMVFRSMASFGGRGRVNEKAVSSLAKVADIGTMVLY